MDDRFTIERLDTNEVSELAAGVTVSRITLPQAILLCEALQHKPAFIDQGRATYYGVAKAKIGSVWASKPFTLTINEFGDATVATDRRTLGRIFDRALANLVPAAMLTQVPTAFNYARQM